jgi:hypothetical protein
LATEKEEAMLPKNQKARFSDFYKSASQNEVLDRKTTLMIHLAAAMALACYP